MRRALVILSAVLAAVLMLVAPASAYWAGAGSGAGSGTTGALAAPSLVSVPPNSLSSVPVTWTSSAGSPTPDGYYVTRTSGGTTVAACASSPTVLLTGSSCTDSTVPAGAYTYTVTAKYRSWTTASAPSGAVTVWIPAKVAFTGQPSNTTAGSTITPAVAVSVQNAAGATVPLSGTSVTVATNPGGGPLLGTTTATTDASGVATFGALSISQAGVGYTLGATSPGLTAATSGAFTITAAPSAGLAFTTGPLSATASDTADLGPLTVRIEDSLGNPTVAPTGGTSVVLTSSSPGTKRFSATGGVAGTTTTLTVTIPAGSSSTTFYYGDRKSGSPVITATASGLAPASQPQTINPAAATKLAIISTALTGSASSTANLGPVRVERQDPFGNPVTTGSSNVALSSNSAGSAIFSPTSVTIGSGASYAEFTYGDTKSGSPVITATSSGLTQVTQTQTITAAAASQLLIVPTVVSGVASSTANLGPITVERRDQFNNLVTAGSTTVNLSSNSPGPVSFSPATLTIAGGSSSAQFNYGDQKAGTPTISATATGLTGATQSATITPGAPTQLDFAVQPSNTPNGVTITPAVKARILDQFGNLTTSTLQVTIAIANNAGHGLLGAEGELQGTLTVSAVLGVATFSNLQIRGTGLLGSGAEGNGYTLRVTRTSAPTLASAISAPFNIT